MTTEILVCVLCRPPELPRDQPRPGRALLDAIENIALRDDLACAALHQASSDGFMPRDARPGRLREGILARLPALLTVSTASTETPT